MPLERPITSLASSMTSSANFVSAAPRGWCGGDESRVVEDEEEGSPMESKDFAIAWVQVVRAVRSVVRERSWEGETLSRMTTQSLAYWMWRVVIVVGAGGELMGMGRRVVAWSRRSQDSGIVVMLACWRRVRRVTAMSRKVWSPMILGVVAGG